MSSFPVILGIETSCDETAAAVINGEGRIVSSVLSSQHDVHQPYGGVVPELAARRHIETIEAIVSEAMRRAPVGWPDLDGVAVTSGPGLAGALLVGVSFGKALAYARGLPLLAVNHLEGHIASAWLESPHLPTPCIVLVVSGGHTHLFLMVDQGSHRLVGRTLDDAAGEAFDKAAKMLGLPYPGGPAIDRLARSGDPRAVVFPRAYLKSGSLDFSFSGLKTALLYYLRDLDQAAVRPRAEDIAAGFQEAIVDVLVEKAFQAVERFNTPALAVVGGVSANSRLRAVLTARAQQLGVQLAIPRPGYCTDNAAMIAAAGRQAYLDGRFASWELEAEPSLAMPFGGESSPQPRGRRRRSPAAAARRG
ncbi:tRNA (adenosine(37)-N6)-threonylcarbamoyltransferase complex transferase subunit TsaD [Candidatus Nitrospira bockiana]